MKLREPEYFDSPPPQCDDWGIRDVDLDEIMDEWESDKLKETSPVEGKGKTESESESLEDSEFEERSDSSSRVDDDELFEECIDKDAEHVEGDDDGDDLGHLDENGDDNLVESDDDYPSGKDIDGDHEKKTVPVFNQEQLYDPTFALGMVCNYIATHTCPPSFNVNNVKSNWLSGKYGQRFKSDPKRNVKGFRIDMMEELRCNITHYQAYRARRLALEMHEGYSAEQYTLLWNYAEEVKRTNPGSTVIIG
ncbi:hypothetical protein DH2020_023703 [Rehmannia glutinosa]|uniref:Uncharacterized protein n=1 Tax=Rehmannia glutinosa TaxID=99300 RepID=A0ABR0WB48_REHGL